MSAWKNFYSETEGKMNAWEKFYNGEGQTKWGRDLTGMDALRIMTWESANLTLSDMGLWGLWEMPDSNFNKPKELDSWEYCYESEQYDRIFSRYWLTLWDKWEQEIEPVFSQMRIETAQLFDILPFAGEDKDDDDDNAHLFAHLPFPDEARPLPYGYGNNWRTVLLEFESVLFP